MTSAFSFTLSLARNISHLAGAGRPALQRVLPSPVACCPNSISTGSSSHRISHLLWHVSRFRSSCPLSPSSHPSPVPPFHPFPRIGLFAFAKGLRTALFASALCPFRRSARNQALLLFAFRNSGPLSVVEGRRRWWLFALDPPKRCDAMRPVTCQAPFCNCIL